MNKTQAFLRAGVASVYERASVATIIFAALLGPANLLQAQAPDLTSGGIRTDNLFWNMGPTGMRGWFYHQGTSTALARQIEVMTVTAGSPADGIFEVGDVILGADGTGAEPVNFTSDARKSLAYAIADAEANDPAVLKLLCWRAGVTSTVTLTLEHFGAYSATAPYNCPKSAAVLEKGLNAVMASGGNDGFNLNLLAFLAANDPNNPNNAARMARAQQLAHELILTPEKIDLYTSGAVLTQTKIAWTIGFYLVALGEYYLQTGDAAVYDSLRAYAIAYANGQSMFGTSGHQFAKTSNGPYGIGYGVVNSANMQCFYGLMLAKEAGINDPEILDAIDRASSFYASYVDRGSIPYGEHTPGGGHESNGKMGIAALIYRLDGTRQYETEYCSRMAGAAAFNADGGHTGPYLQYLWAPLGANVGGEESMAAYFSQQSWRYDLARNWDGSYTFDTYGQGNEQSGTPNWYGGFQMYLTTLLTYAVPLRQTYSTGKYLDPQSPLLSSAEIDEVQFSSTYTSIVASRTTNELMQDITSWSPNTRAWASGEISNRTAEHASVLPTLNTMANDTAASLYSRMGAISTIGKIGDASSVPDLIALLDDPDNLIKWNAANALVNTPTEAKMPHVNDLMEAVITSGKPLLPLDPKDPMQHTHMAISYVLFGGYGGILRNQNLDGIDRALFYPAVRSAMGSPTGKMKGDISSSIYDQLNQADMEALADVIVDSTQHESPADRMFSAAVRFDGLEIMKKFDIAEGVPLAKQVFIERQTPNFLAFLEQYAASSLEVKPDPKIDEFCLALIANGNRTDAAQAVLDAIAADMNPEPLSAFKAINRVSADNAAPTLPVDRTTLRAFAFDHAGGDLVYTWRKVHGAGEVSFAPNGTTAADATTVLFDGTPGQYLFEVTVSDARGLTEVSDTLAVTLYEMGGTLPANSLPSAEPQSITAVQGTPIPVTLVGADPEGYALNYAIISGPEHGVLSGTLPNLIYTAAANYSGSDSFIFEVTDSEGQTSTATVTITVNAAGPIGLAIYEPFDYPVGALNGASGSSEVGLSGSWTAGTNITVQSPTMTYGTLVSNGQRMWSASQNNPGSSRPIDPAALADRGLLNDGSTLWFSMMVGIIDGFSGGKRLQVALANSSFPYAHYITDDGNEPGTGLGFSLEDGLIRATQYFDLSQGNGVDAPLYGSWDPDVRGRLLGNDQRLVVGKITWGADSDLVEIYLPYEDMQLSETPTSTLVANVDQSKFDTLTLSRGTNVIYDEIRFGATLQSVLMGTVDMTPDLTAPSPDPASFATPPTAVSGSTITMDATTAFDPMGVEYYFTCTAGGGNDSGWQTSPVYTDTGLTPGVLYGYTVKVRDVQPTPNETASSLAHFVMTPLFGVVPDLVGLPQAAAEQLLQAAGMSVGNVTASASTSSTVPAGHILSQTPVGPTALAYGTAVNLIISIGDTPGLPTLMPVDIQDDSDSLTGLIGFPVTYTLTFSEEMDVSTINPGDFVNMGDLPISIGAITQVSPGVVTVEVTANGPVAGTLLLAIAAGADIRDLQGDALNTTTAIVDQYAIHLTVPDPATLTPDTWIIPVAATATSSNGNDTPNLTIDGSGLSSENLYGVHAAGTGMNWSMAQFNGIPITDESITFDLGALYDLSDLHIWQFTRTAFANEIRRSVEDFDVLVSGDGVNFTMVISNATLNQALDADGNNQPDGNEPVQSFALVQPGVRYVQIDIQSTYEGGGTNDFQGGFGEVRFEGVPAGTSTNKAPVWNSNPVHKPDLLENTAVNGTLAADASDAESEIMTFAKVSGPAWLSVATDGALSGTPGSGDLGLNVFTVSVTDGNSAPVEADLTIRILPINNAPVFTSDPMSRSDATENAAYGDTIAGSASDPDGDAISYAKVSGPKWLHVARDGTLSGVPIDSEVGANVFTVAVMDARGAAGSATLNITVIDGNNAPVFNVYPIIGADATQDVAYSGTISGTASDDGIGDPLVFAKTGGPAWLSVASDGTLSGTPGNSDVGENRFNVSVTDGISPAVGGILDITVLNVNDAPFFTVDPINSSVEGIAGVPFSDTIAGSASDIDVGDVITYAKVSGPAWLVVAANGALSGVPTIGDVGPNVFTVGVSDGNGGSDTATLNITVTDAGAWIIPVAATATSSNGSDTPNLVIDGSGLSEESTQGLHAAGSSLNWSMAQNNGIPVQDEYITLDLGAEYDLNLIHIWQFTRTNFANEIRRSVEIFDVSVSSDNVNFTQVVNDAVLNQAIDANANGQPDGNEPVQSFGLVSPGVRYVRVEIQKTYEGAGTGDLQGGFGEIRFQGNDVTAPTLAPSGIVDDQPGGPVLPDTPVTYTATFSEDMDETTVTTADFANHGDSIITIDSVFETSPGVFQVIVTPTTPGTLQLKIPSGAVLNDPAGNSLDTTSDIIDDTIITITDPATLTYSVSYDGNGNEGGTVPIDNASPYSYQATVTVLDNSGSLTRSGYTVNGWNTASDGSGTSYAASATFIITTDVTLYAQWTVPTYTVTYVGNANTAGTAPDAQTKTHDIGLTLAEAGDLARNGYVFAGWNTSSDGLGVAYATGDTYAVNDDVTLYAQWNALPSVEAGDPQTVYLSGAPPWSPTSITTLAWYDAADATSISESGGSVSQWNDKSGNGRNIAQANAAAQPTYASNTVSFDGTDDYLWNDAPFMYANGQVDVFVVAGIAPTADDRLLSEGSSTNNSTLYCIAQTDNSDASVMSVYIRNDANNILTAQPDLSATGAFDDTHKLYLWRDTGSQVSGRVNGGTEIAEAYTRSGTFTLNRFSMGAILRASDVTHINADVNEIIICNNLSDADRLLMEGYLAHKWGLEVNLPAGHPYKDVAPGSPVAVAALHGTITDSDGGTLTQQWTKQAGPAADVTFDDASAVDTNAYFTELGTYTLRLTADDGFGQAYDEVTIIVELPPLTVSIADPEISENGGTTTATITRIGTTGDLEISLTSSDPGEATVPPTATILNGQSSVNVTITGVPDGIFDGTQTVTITVTAENNSAGSATVDVLNTDPASYTVTYNGNGSDIGTVPSDNSSPYLEGSTVTVLGAGSMDRTGYNFGGWNTASDGSGTTYAASDTFTISENTSLYARWIGTGSMPIAGVDFENGSGGFSSVPDDLNPGDGISVSGWTGAGFTNDSGANSDTAYEGTFVARFENSSGSQFSITIPSGVILDLESLTFAVRAATGGGGGTPVSGRDIEFRTSLDTNAIYNSGNLLGRNDTVNWVGAEVALIDLSDAKYKGLTDTSVSFIWITPGGGGVDIDGIIITGTVSPGSPGSNSPPVFAVNPINGSDATENVLYTGTLAGSATDEDAGDTLTYAKVSGPAWLSVAADGGLSGTPTSGDVGANAFTVSVTDGIIDTPVEATLNIMVTAASGPVASFAISGLPSQTTVGSALTGITLTALDAMGETATGFTGTVTFGGTVGITGTSLNFVNGVLQNVSITPMVIGNDLTFIIDDGNGHFGSSTFNVVSTPYSNWAAASGLTDGDAYPDTILHSDGMTNLSRFAFGMDPTVANFSALEFVVQGELTAPGAPTLINFAQPGTSDDERAVFTRRKDHVEAGLNYTVHFSADLKQWTVSGASPTLLTDANSTGEHEVVSVPFLATVPVEGGGDSRPPKFMRVIVSMQ